MPENSSLTQRLQLFLSRKPRHEDHESPFVNQLLIEIWPELYKVAARELGRKDRHFAPLTRTELINELWLRHLAKERGAIKDRHHFFALVGQMMRHILVDNARRRLTRRRGDGDYPLSLEDASGAHTASVRDDRQTVEIGILMERLEKKSPREAKVFDLHHFCGYSFEETAEKTGLSEKQVRNLWEKARGRLKRALRSARPQPESACGLPEPELCENSLIMEANR